MLNWDLKVQSESLASERGQLSMQSPAWFPVVPARIASDDAYREFMLESPLHSYLVHSFQKPCQQKAYPAFFALADKPYTQQNGLFKVWFCISNLYLLLQGRNTH